MASRPPRSPPHAMGDSFDIRSTDASHFTCAQHCESQVFQQDLYVHSQIDNCIPDAEDDSSGPSPSLQPGQLVQEPSTKDPVPVPNSDNLDTSHLNEYNRLTSVFRQYPHDLFLNHILTDYCSNESDLENTRTFLFDMLRESEYFPFGTNVELKRRLHTRSGDSVPLKLAKDIYALLSVTEGSDYSELRDVVSNYKVKPRSKSQTGAKTTHANVHACNNVSESEIKLLTEKISCMEADVLLLKQRQIAIEAARSDEIKLLKQTASDTKSDIEKLKTVLNDQCDCLKGLLNNTLDQYAREHMCQVEMYMDKVFNTVTPLCARVEALCEYAHFIPNSTTSSQVTKAQARTDDSSPARDPDAASSSYPSISDFPPLVGPQTACDSPMNAARHSESSLQSATVDEGDKERDTTFGNVPIPTITSGRTVLQQQSSAAKASREGGSQSDRGIPIPTIVSGKIEFSQGNRVEANRDGSSRAASVDYPSYKDIAVRKTRHQRMSFARIYHETGKPPRHGNRQDTKNSMGNTEPSSSGNDAGIYQHIKRRKRTKRYYIGGFLPTVTEDEIASYVSDRDLKVSKVTIFRNRKYNSATIRLNVYDNPNTSSIEEPYFWPRGITCRPWVTQNKYMRNRSGQSAQNWHENQNNYEHEYQDYTIPLSNRYSGLPSDPD